MSRHKILIVADRRSIGTQLTQILTRNRFSVQLVPNRKLALGAIREEDPDLAIIDMESTQWSGWAVALSIRRLTEVPIVGAGNSEPPPTDSMTLDATLEIPVTSRKLLRAVRALLARPRFLQAGNLSLDMKTRAVKVGDTTIQMPPKEFVLLKSLMVNAGSVLSRKTIMRAVWNTDFMDDTRTLDVHIHWVRKKIEADPAHPTFIRTVRGVGYQFISPDGSVTAV